MTDFPANVRIALKDDDLHVLLPGDLAGPYRRSGYEIHDYLPAEQHPQTDPASSLEGDR